MYLFPCSKFETGIRSHYISVHLPYPKYQFKICIFYIRTFPERKTMINHIGSKHDVKNAIENTHYQCIIPNTKLEINKDWYEKNAIFAKILLKPFKHPVSKELYDWINEKLKKKSIHLVSKKFETFNGLKRGKSIPGSFAYFAIDIVNGLDNNQSSRLDFLLRIRKIGQTITGLTRACVYNITQGMIKLIKICEKRSRNDVLFAEK